MRIRIAAMVVLAAALSAAQVVAQPPKLEVQAVSDTGAMPKGASLSPDGRRFYVTNFGQENVKNITIYDTATLALVGTINVPGIVVESVLSPDGATIYASNFERHTVQFIDVATKKVTREITVGPHPKILVLSKDGATLFAANWAGRSVTQIDVASGKVVRTLDAGSHPRGMVVTAKGTLYIANFDGASIDIYPGVIAQPNAKPFDVADHHRIPACAIPRHLALAGDESALYISCFHDSEVHVLDLATEAVTHRVPIGSSPKSIEVTRDGRFIFSADYGKETNSVSVIDTHDWSARVLQVPGMDRGSGIAVLPDGVHALVTGWYDNHIYLIGFEGTGGHPKDAEAQIQTWIRRRHHDG